MLLELTVKNCLSFGDEQTFSLIANNKRKDGYVKEVSKDLKVLHKAVIYGANASGKTNLLKVLRNIRRGLTKNSSEPFLLDETFQNQPSFIKLVLYRESYFFEYVLEFTGTNVIKEELYVNKEKPITKATTAFFTRSKNLNGNNYEYTYNKHFPKNTTYQEGLKQLATSRKLFWQIFADNTTNESEYSNQVINTYKWFFVNKDNYGLVIENFINDDILKNKINTIIQDLDLRVKEVLVEKEKLPAELIEMLKESSSKDEDKTKVPEYIIHDRKYKHISNQGKEVLFNNNQVSDGTDNIFMLLNKLLPEIERGKLILFDELEKNLHPHIVRYIVNLFNSPIINKNHAQLIFTTHDITLLDDTLFRKDEVYFVEKNNKQMTEIYSLDDFNSKKGENIQNRYYTGKYGAIPNFEASIIELEELYNGKE